MRSETCSPKNSAHPDAYICHRLTLVSIAREFLAGGGDGTTSTADHSQVIVLVDEKVVAGEDDTGHSDLPVESVRRLICDASIDEVTDAALLQLLFNTPH